MQDAESPSSDLLTLRRGMLELALSPAVGGSIAWLDRVDQEGRWPILRKTGDQPAAVLDMASFPLVPFVNRIRGGSFDFCGRTVRLEPNMAGDPSPLHGQGWLNPWIVECFDDCSAELRFLHPADEWPWSYDAVQSFSLDEHGLSVVLTCKNMSSEAMPCGLGQHPYFFCGPQTVLDSGVTHAWTIDEHVLPVEKVPATGRFDLADRTVCGQDLDHGFAGWSGSARVSDPGWRCSLELSSPNASFFQLYSPSTGGIFVIEPVTHANAALNAPENEWPELGMRVLEPGEQMRLDMRIDVRPG